MGAEALKGSGSAGASLQHTLLADFRCLTGRVGWTHQPCPHRDPQAGRDEIPLG